MRQLDVSGIVLEDERARALQDAGAAAGEAGRMTAGRDLFAARLNTDQPHGLVVEKSVEDTDRVAAAAHARHDDVRKSSCLLEDLAA